MRKIDIFSISGPRSDQICSNSVQNHPYQPEAREVSVGEIYQTVLLIEAVFTLEGARMDGTLGSRAHKLIEEWALEDAADLRAAWQLAISGKEIPWITPLQ